MGFMKQMNNPFEEKDPDDEVEIEGKDKDKQSSQNSEPPEPEYSGAKVLEFSSTNINREDLTSNENVVRTKITTIKPKNFSDAQTVANCLRDNIPVVMNFEDTDRGDAKRIIDFISGTTYAIDGEIRKVSDDVFICAPENVTVESSNDDKRTDWKIH